jgi:hypothetical protein
VGYLPFYLMVSSGWHSVIASIALALGHSLSIGLLYLLAWKLFAHLPLRERTVLSCLAAALGAATAVFWAMIGSSFIDPLLLPMMLAGLLLLLGGDRPARRAAFAGALFGAAAALKYSNAVFALAAFPLALALPGCAAPAARLRAGFAYVAGGILAVGVLAGPWLVLMAREFGNPVFPLMNAWFQSPYAPPLNMMSERFTPKDLLAALTFPFRMATLNSRTYSEMLAPDVRLAAFLGAGVALLGLAAARTLPRARVLQATDYRVLAFLAVGSVLWLASSANGRYGIVVLLVTGICLARLAERLLPLGAARVALAVLLAVQVGTLVMASPSRWYLAHPWSRHWLHYQVPEPALREPALYVSVEVLPMAVVAPFLHPASAFVNFRGQHSIPAESPKLVAMLERYRGRVRTLGRGLELVDGKPRDEQVKAYDGTLLRIGYRVDTGDCFVIAWVADSDDALSRAANWFARAAPPALPMLSVVSCALRRAPRGPAHIAEERRFSVVFDRIEAACPALFRGQTATSEPLGPGWSRHYAALDARLEAYDQVVLNRYLAGTYLHLGRVSDWEHENPSLPVACGER